LYELSRSADWEAMPDLVTDEMVEAFAVVARYDQLAERLGKRFGGLVDLVRFVPEDDADDALVARVVRELQRLPGPSSGPAEP
jgi:hypothetical protein